MGGYRRNIKTYALKYGAEHDLAGFECTFRGMPLGDTLDLMQLAVRFYGKTSSSLDDEERKVLDSLFERFIGQVIEWNVEDEETGLPVVPSMAAMYSEFEGLSGMDIMLDWINILSGKVSDPKALTDSPSGQQFQGAPIPMGAL